MHIFSTYKQHIQSAHPDLLIEVPFKYKAIVHENEEVTILGVWQVDGDTSTPLRIEPKSGAETSMLHFLANIREHARKRAYELEQKQKQNQDVQVTN